jgi:hypothetical protein
MRVKCPYCDKAFSVYPIPTEQARQHRLAGFSAGIATLSVTMICFLFVGPDIVLNLVSSIIQLTEPRIGMGLAASLLAAPLIFLALAVYDRMVPHFGRPVGEDLHCVKCGYILKGLREPRCPECGEQI